MKSISLQTLMRLPLYLNFLKNLSPDKENISAKQIAQHLELGEIQVRKDLAMISDKGKPRTGYPVKDLICDIQTKLGYHNIKNAIVVGAGRVGKALMSYKGFHDYGIEIAAAFDIRPVNNGDCGFVYPLEMMQEFIVGKGIKIGIITVPEKAAQSVCDKLVSYGIAAIWNFAPTHLRVPDGVLVKNENMAASLAVLSNHLEEINETIKGVYEK